MIGTRLHLLASLAASVLVLLEMTILLCGCSNNGLAGDEDGALTAGEASQIVRDAVQRPSELEASSRTNEQAKTDRFFCCHCPQAGSGRSRCIRMETKMSIERPIVADGSYMYSTYTAAALEHAVADGPIQLVVDCSRAHYIDDPETLSAIKSIPINVLMLYRLSEFSDGFSHLESVVHNLAKSGGIVAYVPYAELAPEIIWVLRRTGKDSLAAYGINMLGDDVYWVADTELDGMDNKLESQFGGWYDFMHWIYGCVQYLDGRMNVEDSFVPPSGPRVASVHDLALKLAVGDEAWASGTGPPIVTYRADLIRQMVRDNIQKNGAKIP